MMINRTRESIENRIFKLQQNPVENARLIRKWQRILRAFEAPF